MTGGAGSFDEGDRKRFRAMVLGSAGAHLLLLAFLALGPGLSPPPPGIPGVVMVDIVTMAPGLSPAPAAAPKAVARRPAPPKPAPKAEPIPPPDPVAPPKPPPPVVNKQVLPKEAVAKPKPAPRPVEKPAEKPIAKEPPKLAPKPAAKQVDYDDLMKDLRADAGEERPEAIAQAASGAGRTASPSTLPSGGLGGTVKVSPEVMAWIRDARIHVRKNWVKAPGFQRLQTQLLVNLDAAGNVTGEPRVVQRSGNPFYDDSVVRAIQKASPLPRPPRAGEWPFVFPSEES